MDRQFSTDEEEKYQTLMEMLSGIYIQLTRTYDMLSVIGHKLGADTVRLSKEHAQGKLFAPDPWISIDQETAGQSDSSGNSSHD